MPERHTTTLDIKVDDREVTRLQKEIERTFSTRSVEAFNDVIERQTKALGTLIKQQEKLQQTIEKTREKATGGHGGGGGRGGGHGGGHGGGGHGHGGALERILTTALGTYLGQKVHGMLHHTPSFTQGMTGGQVVHAGLHALPIPGAGIAASVISSAEEVYNEALGANRARVGAFGRTGFSAQNFRSLIGGFDGGTFNPGIALQLGMSDEEVSQRMGMAAQQTGLSGNRLAAVAPSLLAAGRLGGVDQAGAIIGAAGAAGGRVDPQRGERLIRDAVGTGLKTGIREARLDQFIQSVAGFTEQMRNQGIMIEPESITALVRGVGKGEGMRGMAGAMFAQRAAQGLAGGLDQPSLMTGVLMSVLRDQGLSYEEGRLALEKDPARFLPAIMEKVTQMLPEREGQDPRKTLLRRGMLVERLMRSQGIQISRQQAVSLAANQPGMSKRMKASAQSLAGEFFGRRADLLEPQIEQVRFEATEDQVRKALGGVDPEQREAFELVKKVKATDITVMKKTLPAMAGVINFVVDSAMEAIDLLTSQAGDSKGGARKPLQEGEGRVDPITGLPSIPDSDRAMYEADKREFGAAEAAKNQARRNAARRKKARERIKKGEAKAFSEGGDPLGAGRKDHLPVGAGGSMLPKGLTALGKAAHHAQQMANNLAEAADNEGVDMVITMDEAAGGHD